VVFVDMASTLTALDGVRWLHIATWALRVPAFALIAGYFSNAGSLRPRSVRPLFLTIVVPFLAVGLLHTLERRWATGEWRLFVEDPAWAMWFLLSLLCWRLALPYLARLRHPPGLVGHRRPGRRVPARRHRRHPGTLPHPGVPAVLPAGLAAAGGDARPRLRAGTGWSAGAAVAVLAAAFAAGWLLRDEVRFGWLEMKGPYEAPRDVAVRAALLLAGAVVTLSFVRLMPCRRLPLVTYLGAGACTSTCCTRWPCGRWPTRATASAGWTPGPSRRPCCASPCCSPQSSPRRPYTA
jgi:hypothetical protein